MLACLLAWLQEDADALNAGHSQLLSALFFTAADGPDLGLCTRVVDCWQLQLGAVKARVPPTTAAAFEAVAAVRMLGQLKYSAGEQSGTHWQSQA